MGLIHTQIEINAEPSTIWNILMDFDSYGEWNPFILNIEGEQLVGSQLKVDLKNGDGTMTFKPKIMELEENKRFSWLGKLVLPFIFDGNHIFEIRKTETGSLLIHEEKFRGILVWPILKMIGKDTKNNFEAMNEVLKQRAEAQSESSIVDKPALNPV